MATKTVIHKHQHVPTQARLKRSTTKKVLAEMNARPVKREAVNAEQLDLIRAGQRMNINDVFTKIMKPGGAMQTLEETNIAATIATLKHLATDSICSGKYAQAQRYLSALVEISKR